MSPAYPHPLAGSAIKLRVKPLGANVLHRFFLGLLWITVALGAYVVTEPAPYDVAILFVFAIGFCTQGIQISRPVMVAGAVLLAFLITSSILIAPPMDWAVWLHHSGATLVLCVSWLLFAGVTQRFGTRGANLVLGAYALAAVVASVIALAGYFDLIPNLRPLVVSFNRARSFFKDPNVFGPFLLTPVLTCAMWIQSRSTTKLQRILAGNAAVLMLAAAFLTYSRAAYGTMVFAILVYALVTGVLRSWRSFLWLFVVAGCAALLLSLIPTAWESLYQRIEMHRYDEDRFQVFTMAIRLGTSNILGVGTGQSHQILGYGVHSMYLRLFADHGALGLTAFIIFIAACVKRMVAQVRRTQTADARRLAALILAATLGTLINGFVIETIHWRHLWLLLGLCWYPLPPVLRRTYVALPRIGRQGS